MKKHYLEITVKLYCFEDFCDIVTASNMFDNNFDDIENWE